MPTEGQLLEMLVGNRQWFRSLGRLTPMGAPGDEDYGSTIRYQLEQGAGSHRR
jgi:hypothetical protein